MGPTKAIVKGSAIYEAKTRKIIKDGLTTPEELQDYANHNYTTLPVVDKFIVSGARGTKISKTRCCTLRNVRIVAGWAFEMMSPWSSPTVFVAYPVNMNLIPGLR